MIVLVVILTIIERKNETEDGIRGIVSKFTTALTKRVVFIFWFCTVVSASFGAFSLYLDGSYSL